MEQILQHFKFKNDFIAFANANHLFGKSFNLYKFQEDLAKKISNTELDIIVNSRQTGVTHILALYIAWYIIFNEGKNITILSSASLKHNTILSFVKQILSNYPNREYFDYNKEKIKDNKTTLILKNGCNVFCKSATMDSFRGRQTHLLIIDNAAYIKNLEKVFPEVFFLMSAIKGTKTIIASTPKDDSYFNYLVQNYESFFSEKPSELKSLNYLNWDKVPGRDKEWFEKIKNITGKNSHDLDVEYNCLVSYEGKIVKDKTISLRIPNELYMSLKNKINDNESISDYIRKLIESDCLSE